MSAEPEKLERRFTENEVCEMYNIDRGTLRGWRQKGLIRYLRLPSGQYRYKQSHLEAFDREMEKQARQVA